MNTNEGHKQLLEFLWDIKQGRVDLSNGYGLCSMIAHYGEEGFAWTFESLYWAMFTSWPESSGSTAYPIGPNRHEALVLYNQACYQIKHDPLAFWSGEYGSARIRLVNHCIRYLEAKYG